MNIERTTQASDLARHEKQVVERERTRPGPTFRPDVDIVELPDAFVVTADLPGVDESHVAVRLEEGVLHIEGTLAVEPEPAWQPVHAEYQQGGYQRQFALSDAVDANGIRATMRDGVLELRAPKSARSRPRTVEVRTS
jgi:HSP20 family molecular chaperone IbpA